ncbi:NAD(P)/FAD-dependent oxidoreductase [Stenotrophobium rhamnosiphilum]|uniref:FAD-dependent oxidoreductase n=1 Tax=Stenotrophobium rhamnosiphilum TaxID=2029166 RepID=A0A2T5MKK5_9GAMM|nr:FAD-binding oxidoreductase [Stenotrophobium rhamnosiphilum]PTU33094.1 FAD-dependent oxidoreductase [Stenotrophobium rhamnosiphilum]
MIDLQKFDVIVIGAGIVGAGVAAELGAGVRAAVLEQEAQPGYHTTGRSAAVFAESYGGETVRALSRASRSFLTSPTAGFTNTTLLTPRGFLFVAREDQLSGLETFADQADMRLTAKRLTLPQAFERMPLLRPEYVAGALLDEGASDIEVHALHQGYLSMLKRNGGKLFCNARANTIQKIGNVWRVSTEAGEFEAPILVNAAGAWAEQVGNMAGVKGIGLQPMRRTAALVDVPASAGMEHWPLTIDIDEEFYFKPDAGRLLISPADETLSEPCDAVPDDMDLAIAVDRIERATTLDIRRMHSSWAGLRSFVSDRTPVAGFASDAPGFFWLAGQGGYGVQTAPALSRFAASQVLGQALPADLIDVGLSPEKLSPARLQNT